MFSGRVERWWWVALLILAAGAVVAWDRRDPRFEGERLSVWFDRILAQGEAVVPQERAEPFRWFGRRGAEWLARELSERPTVWVRAYEIVYARFGRWIRMPPPAMNWRGNRVQLARQLLGHLEPAVAGPVLVARMESGPAADRSAVAQAMGELGPAAADVVGPCLTSMLTEGDPKALASVILALGEVLYRPEEVVPRLVPFLYHSSDLVRMETTYTLGTYAPDPARTLKPLMERLEDTDRVVKANAARALGRMGREAAPAVEALLGALRSEPGRAPIGARALEALSSIAPETLRSEPEQFRLWLDTKVSEDPYFGAMAATAQERLGIHAPILTENCLNLMLNADAYIRWEAQERLGEHGSNGEEVRAAIGRGLADPNGLVRQTAQRALERWTRRQAPLAPR